MLWAIQFAQLPRPQRQPENHQNQEPQEQLEHAQEPERYNLHEVPTDFMPPHGTHPCWSVRRSSSAKPAGTPSAMRTWTSSRGSFSRAASSASESFLRLVQS